MIDAGLEQGRVAGLTPRYAQLPRDPNPPDRKYTGWGAYLGAEFQSGLYGRTPLGVFLREIELPPRAPTAPEDLGIAPPGAVPLETQAEFETRRAAMGPIDEPTWKASEWFRPALAYDDGMTSARAQALAEQYDRGQERQHLIDRGPRGVVSGVAGFVAASAGMALDPTLYIPILGPGVRAASVARFGTVAGRALVSSGEAAINVGVAEAVAAPGARRLGDNITWQGWLTDVAMAASIGGVFGAAAGGVSKFRLSRAQNSLHASAEARATLNAAIDQVLHGEPVNVARMVAPRAQAEVGLRQAISQSKPTAPMVLPGVEGQVAPRSSAEAVMAMRPEELQAADAFLASHGVKEVSPLGSGTEGVVLDAGDQLVTIGTGETRMLPDIPEVWTPTGVGTLPTAGGAGPVLRVEIFPKVETANITKADVQAMTATLAAKGMKWENAKAENLGRLPSGSLVILDGKVSRIDGASIPTTQDEHIPTFTDAVATEPTTITPAERQAAEASVGKPQSFAETFGIDHAGDFPEMIEYQQLADAGRLTEVERADFAATTEIMDRASAFAEGLKAAVMCGMI